MVIHLQKIIINLIKNPYFVWQVGKFHCEACLRDRGNGTFPPLVNSCEWQVSNSTETIAPAFKSAQFTPGSSTGKFRCLIRQRRTVRFESMWQGYKGPASLAALKISQYFLRFVTMFATAFKDIHIY